MTFGGARPVPKICTSTFSPSTSRDIDVDRDSLSEPSSIVEVPEDDGGIITTGISLPLSESSINTCCGSEIEKTPSGLGVGPLDERSVE
jgi:hypothetical protein